ncbi:hypothetical protein BGX20_002544 [Mortierella sp. AD010]|nr:hypothetical protein BGX20_002544 [Mortierella sp. AD010]
MAKEPKRKTQDRSQDNTAEKRTGMAPKPYTQSTQTSTSRTLRPTTAKKASSSKAKGVIQIEQASTSKSNRFATATKLKIFCIVKNESTSFSVDILDSETVDDLKKAIKEAKKPKLDKFGADELTLYKVSIPDEENIVVESNIEMVRLAPPSMKLWEKFDSVLPGGTIHVYVKPPQQGGHSKKPYFNKDDLKSAIIAAGIADKALVDGNPDLSRLDANEKTRLLEFLGRRVPLGDSYRSLLDIALSLKKAGHKMDDLKKFSAPNKKFLPVVGTPDLYIRREYPSLYKTIISQFKVPPTSLSQNRLVVTGTPGIGKSAFLVYFTIRLLAESDDIDPPFIIFHTKRNSKCFIYTGGSPQHSAVYSGAIEDFEGFISLPKTWCLVDSSPDPVLNVARTVISASPKTLTEQYKEVEKESPDRYHMAPWELDELEECRTSVRNFKVVTKDFMKRLYAKMGGTKCFAQGKNTLEFSGRILHRWPLDNHQKYYLKWASPHVQAEIITQLEDKLWSGILKDPIAGGKDIAKGPLFGLYVHHIFRKGSVSFETKSLTPNSKTGVLYIPANLSVTSIRTVDEFSGLSSCPKSQRRLFVPNNLSQVTISSDHPIKQTPLKNIIEKINGGQRKKSSKPVKHYFVVPNKIYAGFKAQDYITDNNTISKAIPQIIKTHVKQYALKIDLDTAHTGGSPGLSNRAASRSGKI